MWIRYTKCGVGAVPTHGLYGSLTSSFAYKSLIHRTIIDSKDITLTMAQTPTPAGHEHEDAWDQDYLRVDDTHEIYYEQYGKKDGKPGESPPPSI